MDRDLRRESIIFRRWDLFNINDVLQYQKILDFRSRNQLTSILYKPCWCPAIRIMLPKMRVTCARNGIFEFHFEILRYIKIIHIHISTPISQKSGYQIHQWSIIMNLVFTKKILHKLFLTAITCRDSILFSNVLSTVWETPNLNFWLKKLFRYSFGS